MSENSDSSHLQRATFSLEACQTVGFAPSERPQAAHSLRPRPHGMKDDGCGMPRCGWPHAATQKVDDSLLSRTILPRHSVSLRPHSHLRGGRGEEEEGYGKNLLYVRTTFLPVLAGVAQMLGSSLSPTTQRLRVTLPPSHPPLPPPPPHLLKQATVFDVSFNLRAIFQNVVWKFDDSACSLALSLSLKRTVVDWRNLLSGANTFSSC